MTGTSSISDTIWIDAPAQAVFEIVADARQHGRIDGSGTVLDAVDAPDRLSLGAEFGMAMKQGARYTMKNRVVEFDDGRLIAWRHIGAHRWRYELTPEGGGTRVTETWDTSYYPRWYAWAVALLYRRRHTRGIHQTLLNLKTAAEADAAA